MLSKLRASLSNSVIIISLNLLGNSSNIALIKAIAITRNTIRRTPSLLTINSLSLIVIIVIVVVIVIKVVKVAISSQRILLLLAS